MNSWNQKALLKAAIFDRCRDAAYVWKSAERGAGVDPGREAAVQMALEDLVTMGRIRRIRAGSLTVYIAW